MRSIVKTTDRGVGISPGSPGEEAGVEEVGVIGVMATIIDLPSQGLGEKCDTFVTCFILCELSINDVAS